VAQRCRSRTFFCRRLKKDSIAGNVGFTAFVVNFVVVVAVSLVTKPPPPTSVSVGVLAPVPARAQMTA